MNTVSALGRSESSRGFTGPLSASKRFRLSKGYRMIGLVQILIYLGAVHLIVKGIEIIQIGNSAPENIRKRAVKFGIIVLFVCILIAIAFIMWQDIHVEGLKNNQF